METTYKTLGIIIAIAIGLYITGGFLMSIYGLDPPYIYWDLGFSCVIISLFIFLPTILILFFKVGKKIIKNNVKQPATSNQQQTNTSKQP